MSREGYFVLIFFLCALSADGFQDLKKLCYICLNSQFLFDFWKLPTKVILKMLTETILKFPSL
jgi:hypothetical protein